MRSPMSNRPALRSRTVRGLARGLCAAFAAGALAATGLAGAALAVQLPAATEEVQATPFEAAVNEARATMMADPHAALAQAERAAALALDLATPAEQDIGLVTAWWLQSEALTRLGRPLEARPVAERALETLGADPEPTKLYADLLVSAARASQQTGDHAGALGRFRTAYEVYRQIGQTRSEAIILQSIGSIYNDARQYERAISYFDDATARFTDDASLDLAAFNNRGNAYRELGRYDEALDQYQQALAIAAQMGSPTLEARILNNIASLHVAFGRFDEADAALDTAFDKADGQEGAEWARFLWGTRAQTAYGRGDYRQARTDIERTFQGIDIGGTPQHFREFHEAAADIYTVLGLWRQAAEHLRAFKRLDDEGRDVAASANNALMAAEFDFAEQELEIEQLRSQRLAQDAELARARANQRLMLVGALLMLSLIGIVIALWRQRVARERQRVLSRALYEDAETGLPSRKALERAAGEAASALGHPVTVIALEIKRHSHLRGVLGFATVSRLKAEMAARLKSAGFDRLIGIVSPGVLGVLLPHGDEAAAREEAERMRARFAAPLSVDDLDIDVSVIAGIGIDTLGEACVRKANIAVRQARDAYQTVAAFDAQRYGNPAENLTLMSRMVDATRNGAMSLHYQPKLNLRTGRYGAAEALCRWRDGDRNIAPNDFIPLAEKTGHIRAVTEWSIEQVVRDQKRLHEAGIEMALSVNVSGAVLNDSELAERALNICRGAPGEITFEVTETAIMADPEQAMANLEKWVKAGIRLAIDDYGSGMSSLAYLKTLPSHELKLDRAFVTHVAESKRDQMLVKSTVDLAHNLGLAMTAEGVETDEALALLKLLGADWAQGYGLSKALPLDGLIDFLRRVEDAGRTPAAPKERPGPDLKEVTR